MSKLRKKTLTKTHECCSCGLKHQKVECQGMWYCPNALCSGPGGAWFRKTLKSYRDILNSRHTVDPYELKKKGEKYNKKNEIKIK